jgi:hypothetical protein
MGYTHYWSNPGISPELWSTFRDDVGRIVAGYQRLEPEHGLAGPDGEGEPLINEEAIALNGQTPDWFESFIITPAAGRGFCKTQWRPYDLVVCAVLLRATVTIPRFDIHSDGRWDNPGWVAARSLYESIFGEGPAVEPFRYPTGDEGVAQAE